MKFFVLISLLSFSLLAKKENTVTSTQSFSLTANDWKASRIVQEHICEKELGNLSFEKQFGKFFGASYLNRDVEGIKKVSQKVDQEMRISCAKAKYPDYNGQRCFEACADEYPYERRFGSVSDDVNEKTLLREQCQATCRLARDKINHSIELTARLMDKGRLQDASDCSSETRQIVDGPRGLRKDSEEGPQTSVGEANSATQD